MTLLTTWPTVTDDSGTKTDGTAINKTLTDAMKAAIEALVHSTTNTTTTPEDIIDEVVAARGSEASLDARLDVVLNEDGTLRDQTGLATATQFRSSVGNKDICLNGDFAYWANGAALAPDDWTLAGAAGTIARCGDGEADTFTFGAGRYCSKITRAGTDVTLTQARISTGDFPYNLNVKSQKISVAAKVKSSIASHARITVDDGATTTHSDYHTGGGTEEHLTVTHTISASATKLDIYLTVRNTNGAAYFGGVVYIFSDVAPSDWAPYSGSITDATATARGVLNFGAQTIGGVKTFNSPPVFVMGSGVATVKPPGVVGVNATSVGNVGGGEDDLQSVTLPAGALGTDGQLIRITAMGRSGTDGAQAKVIRLKFGATTIASNSQIAADGIRWFIQCYVVRTGAATQLAFANYSAYDGATADYVTRTTPAETLSGAVTVKTTGESTGGTDDMIISDLLVVEFLGA